jgi:hypothetical protein
LPVTRNCRRRAAFRMPLHGFVIEAVALLGKLPVLDKGLLLPQSIWRS